jgi:hypothetical protein
MTATPAGRDRPLAGALQAAGQAAATAAEPAPVPRAVIARRRGVLPWQEETMSGTDQDFEGRVRDRAYHLWLDAGSPEGQDDDFWHEAHRLERELAKGGATGAATDDRQEKGVTEALGDMLTGANVPAARGLP